METLKSIALRKSTRSFDSTKQIAKADLDTIVAAGCAAPVGGGDYQSLHLSIVSDAAMLTKIVDAAKQTMNSDQSPLYGATALVVLSASEEQKSANIEYANAGCIIENMLLAATDLGIDSVYIWGVLNALRSQVDLWKEVGMPQGYHLVSAVALGYGTEGAAEERELKVSLSANYV